ncbi:MAG: 50S ribosomal protein L9 [Pseudomonadota bacterium]
MKVILTSTVPGLGETGDMIMVKDGYARNYLIPQHLAMAATTGNVKTLQHQKQMVSARVEKERKEAESLAARLGAVSITFNRHAGEEDKLFGSVTTRDIAESLHGEGLDVDHGMIKLEDPIKTLGVYNVPVRLHADVVVDVKVWVVTAD